MSSRLAQRLADAIYCGATATWVRTNEPRELEIAVDVVRRQHAGAEAFVLGYYDAMAGLQLPDVAADDKPVTGIAGMNAAANTANFVGALKRMTDIAGSRLSEQGNTDTRVVVLVRNAHLEFDVSDKRPVFAAYRQFASLAKDAGMHVLFQSYPAVEPPRELKDEVWIIDHELPDFGERDAIIRNICESVPSGHPFDEIADITGGLTRSQLADVTAMSLREHSTLDHAMILQLKGDLINQGGLLDLSYGPERFSDLGGLLGIKSFAQKVLAPEQTVRSRGILLLGPPGTGKSVISRAIGIETNRPTLRLDIGRLMGGIVGKTEENTRRTLAIADAMEPAVLFVDYRLVPRQGDLSMKKLLNCQETPDASLGQLAAKPAQAGRFNDYPARE